MGDSTHALLDSLRARGLKLGLVSNAFDPPALLHRDLEQMGLAERLDTVVFSSEVGRRKPDPLIFETALQRLDVDPARTLFVGDRRYEDVRGASELGMRTVLALWFRADEDDRGAEPDYEAFTTMDVLNIVRRLLGETCTGRACVPPEGRGAAPGRVAPLFGATPAPTRPEVRGAARV